MNQRRCGHARHAADEGFAGLLRIKLIIRVVHPVMHLSCDVHSGHACATGDSVLACFSQCAPDDIADGGHCFASDRPTDHACRDGRADQGFADADRYCVRSHFERRHFLAVRIVVNLQRFLTDHLWGECGSTADVCRLG